MNDGIISYRAWRPQEGQRFRAFCKRGGGEFFAGKFGALICTRVKVHSGCRVSAAPSKGAHEDYIGEELFCLDSVRWRFVEEAEQKIQDTEDRI